MLGLTDDRRKVVLADNRGNKEGATNNGYIFDVNATGFTMMNLTVVNYANLDYEYPGDPVEEPEDAVADVITQAVAMQMRGDKHVYSHVAFLSRLDTTFIRTTRSYFTNVFIEGTDDFLGGGHGGRLQGLGDLFPDGQWRDVGVGDYVYQYGVQGVARAGVLQGLRQSGHADRLHDAGGYAAFAGGVDGVGRLPVRQNVFSLTYHVEGCERKAGADQGHASRVRRRIRCRAS